MRALKTVFWLLVVAGLVGFTVANWQPVGIHIWPGLIWETKLPALVIGALLIGLVPTWLVHRTTRWRLSRRIATLESTLAAQAVAAHSSQPPVAVEPAALEQ